jgi:hypothetical protein
LSAGFLAGVAIVALPWLVLGWLSSRDCPIWPLAGLAALVFIPGTALVIWGIARAGKLRLPAPKSMVSGGIGCLAGALFVVAFFIFLALVAYRISTRPPAF